MNILSLIALPLLALASCNGGDEPKPTPDPEPAEYTEANQLVVYECNERLFSETDAFKTIDAYLPTLQEMGVNVLWLMPIQPRGTVKTVNSPYCVKDYLAIDPKFGTMADFSALVADCHNRGIKVMLDWIANHTAWDNQWYLDHPEWYTSPTGDEKNWSDVVPLNYDLQVVRDTMQACMTWWVNQGVDGFRCDYAHGVPTSFWQTAISAMRVINPDLIMLAETSKTEYYDAGFNWLYSWNYLSAIQTLFQKGQTVSSLLAASSGEYKTTPDGKERLRYITTHDASSENAPSSFFRTADAELAANCLTFFLGGVPMIYSSEEIGYLQKINFFNYNILSFSESNATTQKWISLMKAYNATSIERAGTMTDYSQDDLAMFVKTQQDKSMLVVVNITADARDVKLPMEYIGKAVTNRLTGESETLSTTISLGAYGYAVYTR